jgi:predicted ATPase/DNA-binding winged helix-turn-helix (wHTH) protein
MEASCFSFKSFVLMPARQTLLRRGAPVHLGTRALDILTVLVQRPGTVVDKQELMSLVWADTFVDASNLKVHIAALRRALDEDDSQSSCIATVSGRGYRFVEPVVNCATGGAAERSNPPKCLSGREEQLYGRQEALQQLVTAAEENRLITIVGMAGVGKTALARAVKERFATKYEFDTCLVDLSTLADPDDLPAAVAATLGLDANPNGIEDRLRQHLRGAKLLLVLDTCEGMIAAAAAFVESIHSACPGVRILATSREVLGISGERVFRLPGLKSPSRGLRVTAAEAIIYPAVQLFLDRAAETLEDRELSNADAAVIAAICAELEGLPLGIELAARRVRVLGFAGLPSVLSEQFFCLHRGGRTSPARHHNLAAALDWSLDSLPEDELRVLLKLASMEGHFDLEEGIARACDAGMDRGETAACIASLVSKSLVERHGRGHVRFRLPGFLRHYLLPKSHAAVQRNSPCEPRSLQLAATTPKYAAATRDNSFITFPSNPGPLRRAMPM